MALFTVGVRAQSFTRESVPYAKVAYKRVVRAETRRQAVEKCIPDILKLAEGIDPTIKFISVFCGHKGSVSGSADRLKPYQITRSGEFRYPQRGHRAAS